MRPFGEYVKLVTKPGLRRSLVEVFLLFFLVILLTATFFYMTAEETTINKFRHGSMMDEIPAPSTSVKSAIDSAIESAIDATMKEFDSESEGETKTDTPQLPDDLADRLSKNIDTDEINQKVLEYYRSYLPGERGDTIYITRIKPATRVDLAKSHVPPGKFISVFVDKPVVFLIPVLLIVLALLMAPRILEPIKNLTMVAEKLATGDWDTPIEVEEEDEIGILGRSFEKMRTNLKDYILQLQNTAHELALELNEKTVTLEKARELQRSFVPAYLEKGNIRLATGFVPCEELGGDFFDLQDLGGGKIIFILGDVEGHGITASFNMMTILTVFRIKSLENSDPSSLASEINDMICHTRSDPDRRFSATCIIGLLDQNINIVTLVNAGHPNPIFWRENERRTEEISPGNPILGIQAGYKFESTSVSVGEHDRLFLYTDGLIWSYDTSGEYFEVERLHEILRKDSDLSTEQLVTRLFEKLRRFRSTDKENDDDVLFALFSFEPETWSYYEIPPATKESVIEEVIELLTAKGVQNDIISDLRLAVDELIANAILHGNQSDPEKKVWVKYALQHGEIKVQIRDEGEGFDRDAATFLLDREQIYEPGKRGIYLVKAIMDEMVYNEKGNEVTITKKINGEW